MNAEKLNQILVLAVKSPVLTVSKFSPESSLSQSTGKVSEEERTVRCRLPFRLNKGDRSWSDRRISLPSQSKEITLQSGQNFGVVRERILYWIDWINSRHLETKRISKCSKKVENTGTKASHYNNFKLL